MTQRKALVIGLRTLFVCALAASAQLNRDATVVVRILDAGTGKPTPVRVRLQDSNGVRPQVHGATPVSESAIPIPKEAIGVLWGQQDRAEGYALQPDGSFIVDGAFDMRVPAGSYTVTVSKGNEYIQQTQTLELKPGSRTAKDIRLDRWINMPAQGWYSSDDHIHLQRSVRDNAAILRWIAAEDVQVGNILEMGDFWATFFTQYAFGEKGRYREGDNILSSGQEEPRTPEIGHTISLGASALVRSTRNYYSYDSTFDKVHELGGVTGFAHQGFSFHGYRGMTLNVLRHKIDFLELAQFCVPEGPLPTQYYYQFLDMGFKLTALAGSDFPWCGRGPRYGLPKDCERGDCAQIGNARFYTYAGKNLTFDSWFAGLKAGHTFVTTGPVLQLKVNGKIPGDTLDVAPGTKVHITAEAFGQNAQVPLSKVEIVAHGKVLKSVTGQNAAKLSVDLDLPMERGMWIAARCEAAKAQVAHTTPVYVTVGGSGFQNPENYEANLKAAEEYLREIEQELATPGTQLDSQASRHKPELTREIAEARAALRRLGAVQR